MKCPKCGLIIEDNSKVCPICKKVLQLECPICHTINKSGTCVTCGYQILSKCYKCGKINPTEINFCSNCGTDTYLSNALNESEINEFACVILDFPNVSSLQKIFKSQDSYLKFRQNLFNLLANFLAQNNLKWQIIDRVFVIKFNKEDSFEASTYSAFGMVIELLKLIMKLNVKLNKAYNTVIRCHINILKRDVNTKYNEFKSGFNIKMMYKDTTQDKFYNALQVIVDNSISDILANKVKLTALGTIVNKNKLEMYSELEIQKYIPIPKLSEKSDKEKLIKQLKQISIEELENEDDLDDENIVYNIKKLNFDEQVCEFSTVDSHLLIPKILDRLQNFDKNVISIKTRKKYHPLSSNLIKIIKNNNLSEHVIKITCTEDMKYKPYAFFYELLSATSKFATSAKFFNKNSFSQFNELDKAGVIKSLINYAPNRNISPETTRETLFNLFAIILNSMKNCLIYVEDFENVDITSFEILQLLFKNFNNYNLTLLLFANENFSLHKNAHFLLSNTSYCEICVKASTFENILTPDINYYADILDSFYMQKIAQYTKGSYLYLDHSIKYLLETGILEEKSGKLLIAKKGSLVLSSTLDKLIESRLKFLSKDRGLFDIFVLLIYLGARIDFMTLQSLGIPNLGEIMGFLDSAGYIYLDNNAIYFNNYNILKSVLENFLDKSEKKIYAEHLLKTVLEPEIPSAFNLKIYEILDDNIMYCKTWQKLADVNLLLGDFNAYLNCSLVYLKLIESDKYNDSPEKVLQCKQIIYENIAGMLYKFVPTKIYSLSKMILENIEQSIEKEKLIPIYNKMLQCCLNTGNYSQASAIANKILINLKGKNYVPTSKDFDAIVFWVSLIKINLYFNTGELHNCIELGEKLLKHCTKENIEIILKEKIPQKHIIETIYESLGYVCIAKALEVEDVETFINEISQLWGNLPNSYRIFICLQKFIQGKIFEIDVEYNELNNMNIFGIYVYNLLRAFENFNYDIKLFAKHIYHGKLSAKEYNLTQLDLISDILIGYSYKLLKEHDKSQKIYQNVKETSTQNGLGNVNILCWYFIADLKLSQNNYDMGIEICKNTIALLEKNHNSNELLLILFYILMVKLLKAKGEEEKTEQYLNQAEILIAKNELNKNIYIPQSEIE